MKIYRSAYHPGTASAAIVFARSHIRPIAVCLLPIMIVASIGVLTKVDPLLFLAWSVPVAYVLATWWTFFSLTRRTAELHVGAGAARTRSVWDVARRRQTPAWLPVLGVKQTGYSLLVSIGHAVEELRPDEWAEFDELARALRSASRVTFLEPDPPEDTSLPTTPDPAAS